MKVLNIRLLASLAIAAVVIGAGSYFGHAFQMRRHAGAYLREARRAQDENRPREAVRHFRRYVKLAPHDTEGLALYGLQLAELEQLQPAYLILDQALRRQPERDDWRRQLVETALDLERYGEARANLEEHLLKDHPQDSELLAQLGRCHVALGEDQAAARAFEAAIAAAPDDLDAYVLLAGLYKTRFKDQAESDRCMDRMVAANADDHQAYLIRGAWKLGGFDRNGLAPGNATATESDARTSPLAAADEDARRALELAPEDPETLLFAARVAAMSGRHAEARSLAERALKAQPHSPAPYTLLAEIATTAGDRAAAIEWLRRGVEAVPLDLELRWNFARLLVEAESGPAALAEIETLRKQGYPKPQLSYLEARVAMTAGKWQQAARTLEESRPGLTNWPESRSRSTIASANATSASAIPTGS